jgi:hypothetical protein
VRAAQAERTTRERAQLTDEWDVTVPLILIRVYTCVGDFPAAEREAAAALASPVVAEPVKFVMVPGVRALAWFEAGRLAEADDAARAAEAGARRLDSASISSRLTICACWPAWRWNAATSTPRSSSPNKYSR